MHELFFAIINRMTQYKIELILN